MLLCLCLRLMSYVPASHGALRQTFHHQCSKICVSPIHLMKKNRETLQHSSSRPFSRPRVNFRPSFFSAFHQASALSRANGSEQLLGLKAGTQSWSLIMTHMTHWIISFSGFSIARSLGITLSVELFQCFPSTHPHNQNRTSPMRHSWRCVQGCTLLLIANQPSPLQNWRFDTLNDSNHPKT